jgi:hypothetical protein
VLASTRGFISVLSEASACEVIAAITTTLIQAELNGIGIPQSAFMFMSC